MAKNPKFSAFVIPGDFPPSMGKIKRLSLFFDNIIVVDSEDRSLLHEKEIYEEFANGMNMWLAEQVGFPNNEERRQFIKDLFNDKNPLVRRGNIQLVSSRNSSIIDPGTNYTLYHSSVSLQDLVKSAAPDLDSTSTPPDIPPLYSHNIFISPSGEKSKYDLNFPESFKFKNAHSNWSYLAHTRIARTIKFLRFCNARGDFPIGLDEVTNNLLPALIFHIWDNPGFNYNSYLQNCISLESVDPKELEKNLEDTNWEDILKMRKHLLPKTEPLRELLLKNRKELLPYNGEEYGKISKEIRTARKDFEYKKEKLYEEYEKLRIGTIVKGGAGVGGLQTGINFFSFPVEPHQIFLSILSHSLIATGTLSSELKNYLPAKRKVKQHPFVFIDHLPTQPPPLSHLSD